MLFAQEKTTNDKDLLLNQFKQFYQYQLQKGEYIADKLIVAKFLKVQNIFFLTLIIQT